MSKILEKFFEKYPNIDPNMKRDLLLYFHGECAKCPHREELMNKITELQCKREIATKNLKVLQQMVKDRDKENDQLKGTLLNFLDIVISRFDKWNKITGETNCNVCMEIYDFTSRPHDIIYYLEQNNVKIMKELIEKRVLGEK